MVGGEEKKGGRVRTQASREKMLEGLIFNVINEL